MFANERNSTQPPSNRGADDAQRCPGCAETRAWMRTTCFSGGFFFTIHAALLVALAVPAKFAALKPLPPFAADFVAIEPAPQESETLSSIEPPLDDFSSVVVPRIDLKSPTRRDPATTAEIRPPPAPPHTYVKSNARPILMALDWISRHQSRDGSWSLQHYDKQCVDKSCTGVAEEESLSAATGFAVLPFLAAGQTHRNPGKYQRLISAGLYWLLSHQRPDGDLSAGARQQMYSHAIAAVVLCEEFNMTKEKPVGGAAQKAINFIEAAQDKQTGGWRYHPGEAGDTSVFGWQLMALQSAKLAGLKVDPGTLVAAQRWLAGVSINGIDGNRRGRYSYQAGIPPSPAISSVGLLCNQWLGADRQDLRVTGGVELLLANLPDENAHDVISWFYASQALHNMDGRDWDTWRRKMRRLLVTTQSREGCAAGSWDPQRPAPDAWWGGGGRLMVTSLSCLILELDYRYLPLFGRSRL